ncbi:MAG: methylated-DNA--[protein]-cysteine S-methyltransferase [Anaerolineae bacterium]|nr:methylated-DNA--[protein]-cysteine S-methyltransferase [Anaerolineae bacterium]
MSSPLGDLWLCATSRGVCAVTFDGPDATVLAGFEHYGLAEPQPARAFWLLRATANQLRGYFAGERRAFDLPLDLYGTPFRQSVWAVLQTVPYGKTTTYSDVAAIIAKPRAARAVGQATGANPVSIIVPCHRVIGRNGWLTGYAGGVERKRALLQLEQSGQQLRMDVSGD